jgi:hypothetical protein
MESRFYRDDFEKYLKDQSDLFKMYPTTKVWHGIYNNMHPGRKWPSATSGFFIVLFLLIMNNFNTKGPEVSAGMKGRADATELKTKARSIHSTASNNNIALTSTERKSINYSTPDNTKAVTAENTTFVPDNSLVTFSLNRKRVLLALDEGDVQDKAPSINEKEQELNTKAPSAPTSLAAINELLKKSSSKFSLSYFVTPTLSYRTLSNNSPLNPNTSMNGPSYIGNDGGMMQQMAIGFEVGSNLNYQFSKKLRLITGVQFNYSGYDITASSIHPQQATLILNEEAGARAVTAMSYYGNQPGSDSKVTLHNYSMQAAIPIGMQYVITGNQRLSVSAGATVQPFYVITSNSYLLASDGMSYVNYPSLLRDFNVNTEFGTYITFKANKFNWQVGPHLSYQLLSTYTNNSPYNEHLINYGLRFGISR